jgi:hypothetical protein
MAGTVHPTLTWVEDGWSWRSSSRSPFAELHTGAGAALINCNKQPLYTCLYNLVSPAAAAAPAPFLPPSSLHAARLSRLPCVRVQGGLQAVGQGSSKGVSHKQME